MWCCKELLVDTGQPRLEIHGDEVPTWALVDVDAGTMTVHVSTQSAGAAPVMPHSLQCTEARVLVERSLMRLLTTARMEVRRRPHGQQGQGEEEEARETGDVVQGEIHDEAPAGEGGG
ncbi:hypothetical protein TraAM80_01841 [Trypanosoma rangeli]|uniref:Uncharacterized protein n=1 Tax=Trypanosoma rangeli TaxID=5698 RepID=A0A422NX38_TRYRA|nr:uncharacterized protein TraAM80_01841 [Trypanosoma rangeli]RNF10092.1 hypothetical protein TraAM80_01841 [Trypanosoma rangeli]|eukprot:RNF10092.1 hypothetical protein TraAM80_01841 [Trypanosoma rangeli]